MKLKQSITLVVCCQNAWVALLLLHSHVASNVLLEANDSYKLKSIPSTVRKELHQGWTACRSSSVNDPALGCVENNQRPGVGSVFVVLNVTQLPTTALAVLLDNHQIAEAPHITMENLYYSQNLAQIPDISVTGRDYYTLLYQIEIPSIVTGDPTSAPGATKCPPMRRIVEFSGINYRATVWCNGVLLKNRQSAITTSFLDAPPNATLDGMFVRHRYDISACVNRSSTSALLVVKIDPPDHPGYPVVGQQGGSHDLAKDGAVPQYMLGWDWCSSMPDRATGFFGSVTLADSYQSGMLSFQDPAIQTVAMEQCHWEEAELWACSVVTLRILVRIESWALKWSFSDPVIILKVISDWGEEWLLSFDEIGVAVSQNGFIDIQRDFVVESPEEISFWWPHGVGIDDYAHLHTFRILLQVDDVHCDSATVAVGIRKIDVFIPDWNNGQLFRINDHDVYLVGGNWIGTDQALRFSASGQRYCEEVLLHHHAGLNLIRVWGGGVAERDQFYDCADRFGVLVYQEFWMTGDNNGRWAGNYSWPLDYGSYLSNVEDTVKRLRRHPSLLLYGGCNECLSPRTSPWAPNPPRVIDDGIGRLIQQFDPGRFYISSSMGGPNKADTFVDPSLYSNRSYSLAYADGPYEMLLVKSFFDSNHGLPFENVSITFQPEIGSASVPTYSGLLKFMSLEEASRGYPRRSLYGSDATTWAFHKFQPWTTALSTNGTYDHVYTYFGTIENVDLLDWISAAQLAAHHQYQNMFNGFIANMFRNTSGVIMWKTQSPWPALRGFLYDWYLESTGALVGVRSALRSPTSIVFDAKNWQLIFVNRNVKGVWSCDVENTTRGLDYTQIGAKYSWIDLHGKTIASGNAFVPADYVPGMWSALLDINGNRDDVLQWPKECTDVCFLRLQEISCHNKSPTVSWYWLTDPLLGDAGNFSALGELRRRPMHGLDIEVERCIVQNDQLYLDMILQLPSQSTDILFYPTISLRRVDGSQVLPLLDSDDTNIVILPGTFQRRHLHSPTYLSSSTTQIFVTVTGWNVHEISKRVDCHDPLKSHFQLKLDTSISKSIPKQDGVISIFGDTEKRPL